MDFLVELQLDLQDATNDISYTTTIKITPLLLQFNILNNYLNGKESIRIH